MAKKSRKKATKPVTMPEIGRDGEGKPAVTVHFRPVVCPRCNSPKRKQFRDGRLITQDYPNVMFDPVLKVRYTRVVLRMTECLNCGQKLRVKEFTMSPDDH